jgi:hypothetical protein
MTQRQRLPRRDRQRPWLHVVDRPTSEKTTYAAYSRAKGLLAAAKIEKRQSWLNPSCPAYSTSCNSGTELKPGHLLHGVARLYIRTVLKTVLDTEYLLPLSFTSTLWPARGIA